MNLSHFLSLTSAKPPQERLFGILIIQNVCSNVNHKNEKSHADLIVLGHVITMDEHKPYAEAVAVKDGKIIYVGDAGVAKKLADSNTKVYDYGKNSVYPGFLEAHCHTGGAGYRMTGLAYLDIDASLESCVQAMKEYMAAYPDREQ